MYSPVSQKLYVDKEGKSHVRRIFGLKQSSAPGRHVVWDRDCNAARNFIIREQAVQATGMCVSLSRFAASTASTASYLTLCVAQDPGALPALHGQLLAGAHDGGALRLPLGRARQPLRAVDKARRLSDTNQPKPVHSTEPTWELTTAARLHDEQWTDGIPRIDKLLGAVLEENKKQMTYGRRCGAPSPPF